MQRKKKNLNQRLLNYFEKKNVKLEEHNSLPSNDFNLFTTMHTYI